MGARSFEWLCNAACGLQFFVMNAFSTPRFAFFNALHVLVADRQGRAVFFQRDLDCAPRQFWHYLNRRSSEAELARFEF